MSQSYQDKCLSCQVEAKLIGILQKCRQKKDSCQAKRLQAYLLEQKLESHPVLGNYLVPMLVECGNLADAQLMFDGLPVLQRNEFSWNSLISGYADSKKPHHATVLYLQMQQQCSVQPNRCTYLSLLNACACLKDAETGRIIHVDIIKRGLERDVYAGSALLGNTLVDMYGKCSSLSEARWVFDHLPIRTTISWNALMAEYGKHGLSKDVLYSLKQMQQEGNFPDSVTFVCSLNACGTICAFKTGYDLHAEIVKRGLEKELYVGNAMVDMYIKCSSLVEAHKVFEKLPVRDALTWNPLIAGYAEQGFDEEVVNCYKQMQLEGISVNATTFIFCMKACGTIGALETGREVHNAIRRSGLERDLFVGSMLVDMYGKCGAVADGREVFDNMLVQDVVAWTAMIKAYGENHEGKMAVGCFHEMQLHGVAPDLTTFTCLLAACSHASLVLEGQEYFKVMQEQHDIEPTLEHCACMVDLFARSGLVFEAEKFIAAMQCRPTALILMALLSACKIYGKLELGQRCFQQLVEANEEDAAAYLMMADIYAIAGRWHDAIKMEELRNSTGAKKKPGNASIEVNWGIYEFIVGSSQNGDELELLTLFRSRMKEKGYVPSLDFFRGVGMMNIKLDLSLSNSRLSK